nr:hypothetical protein [Spirochaetales bacterium]
QAQVNGESKEKSGAPMHEARILGLYVLGRAYPGQSRLSSGVPLPTEAADRAELVRLHGTC